MSAADHKQSSLKTPHCRCRSNIEAVNMLADSNEYKNANASLSYQTKCPVNWQIQTSLWQSQRYVF